jgi:signal transduction histidine kinase/ActR/RegA family two-component response regulator
MRTEHQNAPEKNFLVVGVDASAGGLESFERMFAGITPNIGMAFVVLQHSSPDFERGMDALLARQTTLPIHRVTDGMLVEPGAVYLMPPKTEMIIADGRLLLTDEDDARRLSLPIDHFFRSLAHDMGRRSVAVILSGAGSDGSRGLFDVHDAGGLVLCAGVVDACLRPEEMAEVLVRYARDPTQRSSEDARRALAMRDELMALLSHELRNPLSALLHACTVLKTPNLKDQHRALALTAVERQSKRIARLLDDVLDVSRVRQDEVELRKQQIDLRATIDAAVERVRPLAESSHVRIEVELPADEIAVFGDSDRLQQVEGNLLSNAVKYTPPGKLVRLKLANEDGQAVLRVRDEGIGIAPDMLERIFEPFVRAVDAREPPVHPNGNGGMGLGLTLARSFVRAHGGDVRAFSAGRGHGAELVVRLPLAERVGQSAPVTEAAGGGEALVLVEDQEDNRALLAHILEDAGYSVVTAEDGRAAIELIGRHRPRIAIIDIGLPVLSGYDVARAVRRLAMTPDIFMVALTGYGQQQDRDAVLQAGFDQHLVKPIDAATLLDVLRKRRRLRVNGN